MTTPEERAREIIDRASSLSQGGSVSEASQSLVASRAGARMRDELSIVSQFQYCVPVSTDPESRSRSVVTETQG